MNKKVLITGSNGFIGSNLKDLFLTDSANSYEIFEFNSNTDIGLLETIIPKVDVIIHLAAVHRPQDEKDFQTINVELTRKIVELNNKRNNSAPIFFTSSIHVYGNSTFGSSKILAESLVMTSKYYSIFRLTNLFGPYGRPNSHSVVANFMFNTVCGQKSVVNAGNQISLLYVKEVTGMIKSIIDNDKTLYSQNFISLEKGTDIYIEDLASLIGHCAFLVDNDVDNDLDSRINTKFEQEIIETYKWYKKNYEGFID